MSTLQQDERLLSREEVEERFGISKRYLEIAVCRHDGPPYIKIGRLVRYRVADIRAWISANRVENRGPGRA